jgi:carbonic anhydrase/acetyltransferase-like protein (isoleucine patch superfamily)
MADKGSHTLPETVFQAPGAQLYGDIRIAEGVSIWPNAVMRAESHYIEIGSFSNVQDFAMIHVGGAASIIGNFCSITHHSTVHGATVGNNCLLGIGVTIMDGAVIGENSIVAGHTIVIEGTRIPANSVVAGVPGKVVAQRNNYVSNKLNAMAYHENALAYAKGHHRRWSDPDYAGLMAAWKTQFEREIEASA